MKISLDTLQLEERTDQMFPDICSKDGPPVLPLPWIRCAVITRTDPAIVRRGYRFGPDLYKQIGEAIQSMRDQCSSNGFDAITNFEMAIFPWDTGPEGVRFIMQGTPCKVNWRG